ncbi:MAG TPA: alpha/beta hydrolase [Propionibacteriaceae bacterium]|jgi:hypothetical protein|nr:alpha/beta hydrolase [Propionibacteriaceae bacterium]
MGHETDVDTTGSVVSADGTRIGYRRLGQGASVILLHGGVNASQHMMKLGRALADAFTVYLPDRRGRGMSGAFGPAYSIQREDEDLAALVEHTAAECVFRPANGGLFALHGAIGLGQVRRVAAYENLPATRHSGAADLRSETDPMFVDCAEALHEVLPHSTVLRLPGLNHDSAQTYGKPDTIAAALRLFWAMNDLTAKGRIREAAMEPK